MEFEIIKEAGAYAGAIAAIIALCALLIKPIRVKLAGWITRTSGRDDINGKIDRLTEMVQTTINQNNELQAEMTLQSEALKASIRNSILNLYYKCTAKSSITTYELQNLSELYENYKALGGNSFVTECVERLRALPVME